MSDPEQHKAIPVFNIKKGPSASRKGGFILVLLNFENEVDLDWLVKNKPKTTKVILLTDMNISHVDVSNFENSKLIEIKKSVDSQAIELFIHLLVGGEEKKVVDLSHYSPSQMQRALRKMYRI